MSPDTWEPIPSHISLFRLQDCHLLWLTFPDHSATGTYLRRLIHNSARIDPTTPRTQRIWTITYAGFGLFPVRSPLLRESLLFSFPRGTEMFHFPRFTLIPYVFRYESGHITGQRLPDSGIFGSQSGCDYPKLIAASHALHRLLAPRHPPCTLSSLTIKKIPSPYAVVKEQTRQAC